MEGGHLKGKGSKKLPLLKPEEVEEWERIRKEEDNEWVNNFFHGLFTNNVTQIDSSSPSVSLPCTMS